MKWIKEGSFNVAYIPPEAFAETAIPNSMGNTSKADSWALGCLTIWFVNIDQPLKLVRHKRFASGVEVFKMEQPLLPKLQALYAGAGQQKNLVIGPKIELIRPVPCACDDFLGHCSELDPAKRWSLEQLRLHPFLDLSKSVDDLFAMDAIYYQQTLPFKEMFTVTKVQKHPYLRSEDMLLTHQIGELVYRNPGNRPPQVVDIMRFGIYATGEQTLSKQRDLWTKAFGKMGEALAMEASTDVKTKEWANVYRMRALQQDAGVATDGNKNIVQHFGCQFVEHPDSALPMEIQVFSEHCAGGSFKDAAEYRLPMDIIVKWTREALQGLKYLHGHRIVHRNINSSVILFSESSFKGTIKIGGFQYMRQLETDRTEQHAVSARQGHDGRFAAPEVVNSYAEDVNVGRKCDIWGLGCVFCIC
ncbi:uncharacterized protein LOC129597469 [Paramacrobiotus metropolitanus]|uniref:uncharacterized protein LOC129597469 n=1 Tax=Paramacrobiotus metropolitanus TaxID=2943436 RepID=UPI0024460404|nr:uncharacterized protein LOC129597469 [Paramacrobiotus metropolitanus]